ncbi:MAG: hypothetical protein CMI54_03955 [Parcubacteria group bacterium]|nr:hypothetical protein [Parcubacteria group bacterium]|tara:strand:- start:1 stop:285 length:285 start_codon:yes stop_codon:yes gene_type:complete
MALILLTCDVPHQQAIRERQCLTKPLRLILRYKNVNDLNNDKESTMTKVKKIVVSNNRTMEMVIIQTPIKGVKNRKGEQAYDSVTKHRKRWDKA